MVCFESKFSTSAELKVVKCVEVVEVINSTTSYNCHLHTMQIGSRGMIDKDSLSPVQTILQCMYEEALASLPRITLGQCHDRVSEDMV